MKNFLVGMNIILVVAVAVLYYLHFSAQAVKMQETHVANMNGFSLAYVNSDSLLDQYNYFKNKKSELVEKQNKVKNELKTEGARLQNDAEAYQQKGAAMSDQERRKIEEELTMRQQNLMQKKDDLLGKLEAEQSNIYEDLYSKLMVFMRAFNKNKNYSFILGYQKGGGILFANDSLNITNEIISGLNEAYEKEIKGK